MDVFLIILKIANRNKSYPGTHKKRKTKSDEKIYICIIKYID